MVTRKPSVFETFMASNYGRAARVALGLLVIGVGLLLLGGTTGLIVAALGIVPIAAGVLNLCPLAPLWGGHFVGARYCRARPQE